MKFAILIFPLLTGCASVQFAADLARANPIGFDRLTDITEKPNDADRGELKWYEIVLNIL